jgi:cell wall-associated NlpC family hydrolase
VRDYIRKPYKNGARGPDAYDCYGLMAAVQRQHFGLDVSAFDGEIADRTRGRTAFLREVEGLLKHRESWVQVDRPRPGDGVLLRFGDFEAHCGVVVAVKPRPETAPPAGWMLHVHEGVNVVCVDWNSTEWANRVVGFWRYRGQRNG